MSENVRSVAKLEAAHLVSRTGGERVSSAACRFVGSGWSIVAHAVVFAAYIAVNLGLVSSIPPFDPYPFGGLTVALSVEAIFLALFVLISQNHASRLADRRAQLDLQVNLLAEQESTATLRVLHRIARHLGIPPETRAHEALESQTDLEDIATELDRRLPDP